MAILICLARIVNLRRVSRNRHQGSSHPEDWTEFLLEGAKSIAPNKHILRLISRGDFLTACEIIKTRMGKDDFNSFVTSEFLVPQFHAAG
jgi:hypothetical protein